MDMEPLLQALLSGASMHRAPGIAAPYAALRARLLDLCSNDPALASALLAFENHPASTTHQATLEQRLSQLQPRYDTELNTSIQAVLAEVAQQEALGDKTTGSPVASRPGEIVCERCGQPQPASRLVCWSCGREFISQEAAAVMRASAVDPGKTVRLPALPTPPTIAAPAPVVRTEGNMSPELLQTFKKISADQEAIRKALEAQGNTLRQLVGLQNMAHPVIVQDLRMDFGSMVVFMIKWSIAAIPAFLILFVLLSILMSIFGGIFLSAMLR
jgi:hypothetical protein